LYTRSGVYLCQLPNFNFYMKMMRGLFTSKKEFDSNDAQTFFYNSQSLPNVVPAITANNGAGSMAYEEQAYVVSDTSLGISPALNNITSQVNLTLNMKLGAIKKTIFALNKDIVFPDIIVMRILFNSANQFAYFSQSGTDPAAGNPTAIASQTLYSPASGTSAVQLNNLTLYLATEKNEDLAQTVRALVNSAGGLNLLIDFPYIYSSSLSGQNQNISLRFNRGHGKNMTEIVSSAFNQANTVNTIYDNSNVYLASSASQSAVGSKILNYYSQLDNVRLADIQINCGNPQSDDYRENKAFLVDTAYLTSEQYNNKWFHMDRFAVQNPLPVESEENLDKGMSLIVERKYDLLPTMNLINPATGVAYTPAFNWYTVAVIQKDLHIGSNMIQYQ